MNHVRRGFTLIELLVVISIIGTLSSTVLAGLNSARVKGRVAAGITFERNAYAALYDSRIGEYDFADANVGCESDNNYLLQIKDVGGNSNADLKPPNYISLCSVVNTDTPLSMAGTISETGLASINGREQLAVAGPPPWSPPPPTYGTGVKRQSIDLKFDSNLTMSSSQVSPVGGGTIQSLSISTWLKCSSWNPGDMVISSTNNTDTYGIRFDAGGTNLSIVKNAAILASTPAAPICDGTWHQVFGSMSSTASRIYIDGRLATNSAGSPFSTMTTANVILNKTNTDIYVSHVVVYGNTVP